MSAVSLADQVAFMQEELATREESYPLRVEMRRMTKGDAEKGLARTRAVLASLENLSEYEPALAEDTITGKHHREVVSGLEKQLAESEAGRKKSMGMKVAGVWPILLQVQKCAKEHASDCIHCQATANVLDEVMK